MSVTSKVILEGMAKGFVILLAFSFMGACSKGPASNFGPSPASQSSVGSGDSVGGVSGSAISPIVSTGSPSATTPAATNPTATLTANGASGTITAQVGSTFSYNWNSSNASTASSTYSFDSPACGIPQTGTWVINTLSGSASVVIPACESGHTVTLTYTVTGPTGLSAQSVLVVNIPATTVATAVGPNFAPFTLAEGQSISSNGIVLVMQGDGNLVLYQGATALWNSGTNGRCKSKNCYAAFQGDGNLVVYKPGPKKGPTALWNSESYGNSGAQLVISPSAPYMEITQVNGAVIWQAVQPVLSNFLPDWLDTQMGSTEYVAVMAETLHAIGYTGGTSAVGLNPYWSSVTSGMAQPFRTIVDRVNAQVYWRKDDLINSFYGELWNWDSNYVYLTTETMPNFGGLSPAGSWNAVEDQFRQFGGPGRFAPGSKLSPATFWDGYSYPNVFNTFACLDYTQYVGGTCIPYQSNFQDAVTIQVVTGPFDLFYDGPLSVSQYNDEANSTLRPATIDPTFHALDGVVIINQVHQGGVARERYFIGSQGGRYLGIVRWDASAPSGGNWVVTDRTIGFKIDSSPSFSWSGMINRGAMARP